MKILDSSKYATELGIAPSRKVSPVESMLLFTPQERVALKTARSSDPAVDDFFDIVEDPRLTFVDLSLPSTVQAFEYLAYRRYIQPLRVREIQSGAVQ